MAVPASLTKKVGPFPVYVYLVAGTAAVGIGLYLRHKKAATPAADGTTTDTLTSLPYTPQDRSNESPHGNFSNPPVTFEAPPSVERFIPQTPTGLVTSLPPNFNTLPQVLPVVGGLRTNPVITPNPLFDINGTKVDLNPTKRIVNGKWVDV